MLLLLLCLFSLIVASPFKDYRVGHPQLYGNYSFDKHCANVRQGHYLMYTLEPGFVNCAGKVQSTID